MANDYNPQALLSMPLDDFHAPPKMPLGSYVAMSPGYEFDKTKPKDKSKAPTDLVNVKVALIEPFPDVDANQLNELLTERECTLPEVEQRPINFFLTKDAMFRMTEFLREHAKISSDEAPSAVEALEVLKSEGRQFGVLVEAVENARDPKNPFHQITRTFALPES